MAVESSEVNLREILTVEAPAAVDSAAVATTTPSVGSKRKRSEPRDPNAPKRPCSAYIYFSNEMRPKLKEEKPELGMAERSKHIGKTWATLEAEKKKRYQELANADKQRYIREYLAYQETDTYKQFIRNRHPGLKKAKPAAKEPSSKSKKTAEKTSVKVSAAKMPVSCQQQFIPGSNVPIFSEDFLQHNRDLESQLRKLRQTSANLEEENALLSRHVENMKSAVEKVQKEVQKQEKKNESLQSHLAVIREVLAVTFKDVPLPGSKETPTPATIDSYMSKLQSTISSEPDKHPLLMEKVSAIAKHLGKVLKEKVSQDALRGTALEEREEGEERAAEESTIT